MRCEQSDYLHREIDEKPLGIMFACCSLLDLCELSCILRGVICFGRELGAAPTAGDVDRVGAARLVSQCQETWGQYHTFPRG